MTHPSPNHPPFLSNPLTRLAASALEPFYRLGVAARSAAYYSGLRRVHRVHVPVISIGNLTAGGTGKTPTVAWVAERLRDSDLRPAILMRGYKGDAAGTSDEQQLLMQLLPNTPIVINPNRVAGARDIHDRHPGVNVILLDDGFQHRRLHRDMDIVLIDATNPFGYWRLLPRGLLRESPAALRRAHAVVVTRCDLVEQAALNEIDTHIASLHGKPPVAHTAHTWSRILDDEGHTVTADTARVHIVTGIGNPAAFVTQARRRFDVVDGLILPDHMRYEPRTMSLIQRDLKDSGADAVLTTEKDWVKLGPLLQSHPVGLPVWRPQVCIGFLDGERELGRLLHSAVMATEQA